MSHDNFGDFRNFARPPETSGTAAAFLIVLLVIGMATGVLALGFGWISIDIVRIQPAIKAATQSKDTASVNLTQLDWDIPDGHFYTQTNGEVQGTKATGYSVTNTDGIPFWDEYQRLGSFMAVGYPLSSRFQWKGLTSQMFQKAVMQWNPDSKQVELNNVMDELHLAGKDDWLMKEYSVPRSVPDDFDVGRTWEQARDNRMLFIGKSQAMVDKYKSVPDPLKLYGLPSSGIEEIGDAKVIRLQRAVFRQWTKDMPGAMAGDITVANSGDMLLASGLATTAKTTPEQVTPPASAVATPTPDKPAVNSNAIIVVPDPSQATPAPGAMPSAGPAIGHLMLVGKTSGEGVFIRRTAHSDDKIVAWPENTIVKVIGEATQSEGKLWLNVQDPAGNRGWIPSEYLIDQGTPASNRLYGD
ncbi:MAG TPA: hypothetical protein VHP11_10690 [Tepidisphaeraceae bacterium]|nr:hypothetical protein [Tepidisphaeraceae bacterium]